MSQLTLQEIITAHTDALAAHSEGFLPTIRLLLLQGAGPVSPSRLATAMQWTPQQVEAFVHDNNLAIDDRGHITRVEAAASARWARSAPCVMLPASTIWRNRLRSTKSKCMRVSFAIYEGRLRKILIVSGTFTSYFVSREAATTWPGLHPEAVLLSVEDAARLAEALASAARTYAEKAEF